MIREKREEEEKSSSELSTNDQACVKTALVDEE
jgi:hypothetical protein